jgi:hypothetical protein
MTPAERNALKAQVAACDDAIMRLGSQSGLGGACAAVKARRAELQAQLDAADSEADPLEHEADMLASTEHGWDTADDYEGAKVLALAALRRGMELKPRPVVDEAWIEAKAVEIAGHHWQKARGVVPYTETAIRVTLSHAPAPRMPSEAELREMAESVRQWWIDGMNGAATEIALEMARRIFAYQDGAYGKVHTDGSRSGGEPVSEPEFIHTSGYAEMLEPDEPEWFDWHGGECPVPAGTRVEVGFRDGDKDTDEADEFRWSHKGFKADILAYRILGAAA